MQDDNREQLVVWVKKRLSNHNEAQPDCDCQYCDWRRDYLSAIDTIDTLTARIAELEGWVARLGNELEWIDEHLFTDNVDPDATLGFITEDTPEAKRLKAICHLLKDRTRLSTLEQAAGEALEQLNDLIGESGGVYGLHLNGDVAPWAEITVGGRFERLEAFDTLAALLPEKGAKG